AALIDEKAVKEFIKEMQRVLIASDVNVQLVFDFSKIIEQKVLNEKPLPGISPKEHTIKVVYDELVKLMGDRFEPNLKNQRILLLGLQGSGKTTSIAKLARFYRQKGLSVGVICCDLFRPAAYEQLKQLSEKANVSFYGDKITDVRKIINDALTQLGDKEILLLDSSGRSAFDNELTEELKMINEIFKPDEKFLVVSADLGQVAEKQASEFNKNIGLTGVIVTKMDGSGKGGGAVSAVATSKSKLAFIGTGEKLEDLETYDSKRFVNKLLGFPDLEALLEKVKEVSKEQNLGELVEDELTIKGFYEQLKATKKLGPLKNVLGMIGAVDLPKDMLEQSEGKLKKFESIINSMTLQERNDAELIKKNKGRIERIAKGSGTKIEEVKEFLNQFEQVKKMFNMFKKNRGFRKQMEQFMKKGFKLN
ncbi:signal recognition particle receptor subunit alpha, partial [Candidatus Micrarchaeota archaeon]|nr:signal recognition particle receptor subunit alpha [Candidatus Micrarchaeota archaeon]